MVMSRRKRRWRMNEEERRRTRASPMPARNGGEEARKKSKGRSLGPDVVELLVRGRAIGFVAQTGPLAAAQDVRDRGVEPSNNR
eukprot:5239961-Pyramimonas_sp.AAC.1